MSTVKGWTQVKNDFKSATSKSRNSARSGDEWYPNKEHSQKVRFVAGNYDGKPVFSHVKVFIPGGGKEGKGAYCPCNCFANPEAPCVPHYYKKKGYDWNDQSFCAMNAIILDYFHKVEKSKEVDGKKITWGEHERCDGRGCKECTAGKERIFGKRAYYDAGYTSFHTLIGYDDIVGKLCLSCGGQLELVAFVCPECGGDIADIEKDKPTAETIVNLQNEPIPCHHCGKTISVQEELNCYREVDGKWGEGCEKPERTTIFDVDFEMMRTQDGKRGRDSVISHTAPHPIPDNIKHLVEPFDFQKRLGFMKPEVQAKICRKDNPYGDSPPGSPSQEMYD